MLASEHGHVEVARLLVAAGANKDWTNRLGVPWSILSLYYSKAFCFKGTLHGSNSFLFL